MKRKTFLASLTGLALAPFINKKEPKKAPDNVCQSTEGKITGIYYVDVDRIGAEWNRANMEYHLRQTREYFDQKLLDELSKTI